MINNLDVFSLYPSPSPNRLYCRGYIEGSQPKPEDSFWGFGGWGGGKTDLKKGKGRRFSEVKGEGIGRRERGEL